MSPEKLAAVQQGRKELLTMMAQQIRHHHECLEALHHAREQTIKLIERDEKTCELRELKQIVFNYEFGLFDEG
jgi:hypothetical protein